MHINNDDIFIVPPSEELQITVKVLEQIRVGMVIQLKGWVDSGSAYEQNLKEELAYLDRLIDSIKAPVVFYDATKISPADLDQICTRPR